MNINSLGQQTLVLSCEEDEDRRVTTKNGSKGDWIGFAPPNTRHDQYNDQISKIKLLSET